MPTNRAWPQTAGTYGCIGTHAIRADDLRMRSDPYAVANDQAPTVRLCADIGQRAD